MWLMPRPESIVAFAFTVAEHDKLGEVADGFASCDLWMLCAASVHIANDLKVLSSRMTFPGTLQTKRLCPIRSVRSLRDQAALGAWNVMGALYGTHEMVAAAKRMVAKSSAAWHELCSLTHKNRPTK